MKAYNFISGKEYFTLDGVSQEVEISQYYISHSFCPTKRVCDGNKRLDISMTTFNSNITKKSLQHMALLGSDKEIFQNNEFSNFKIIGQENLGFVEEANANKAKQYSSLQTCIPWIRSSYTLPDQTIIKTIIKRRVVGKPQPKFTFEKHLYCLSRPSASEVGVKLKPYDQGVFKNYIINGTFDLLSKDFLINNNIIKLNECKNVIDSTSDLINDILKIDKLTKELIQFEDLYENIKLRSLDDDDDQVITRPREIPHRITLDLD